MKKALFTIMTFTLATLMVSCGGSKKDEKKDEKKDTTQVVEEQKPTVKDFAYFEKIAKEMKLEGLELTSGNKYADTASKSFSYGYNINNGKEKGADYIILTAGSVKRLGNKDDILNKSLEEYKSFCTKTLPKGQKVSDFKEWKKGDQVFYYCTFKGVSDQMGGKKNYNRLSCHYVIDDVYLDGYVKVYDSKQDLANAEKILIQLMEYIVR
ncbi:MAG: hypothetical protein V2A54_06950 [Bacteroidota bacterium]